MLLFGCGQSATESTAEKPTEIPTEDPVPEPTEEPTPEVTEDLVSEYSRYTIYDVSFELPSSWNEYQGTESTLSFFPEQNNPKDLVMVSSFEHGYDAEKFSEDDAIQLILTLGFDSFGFDVPEVNYDNLLNGKRFGWDTAVDGEYVYQFCVYANDGKALSYVMKVPVDNSGTFNDYIEAIYHSMETIEYVD